MKNRKMSWLLAVLLVAGCLLQEPVNSTKAYTTEPRFASGEETPTEEIPTSSPEEATPTLSPEEEALKARVEEAMLKTSAQPVLGCYGRIGNSKDQTMAIMLDSVEDKGNKILHETETHVLVDGTKTTQTKEQWIDQAGNRLYYYDAARKSYMFDPYFDGEPLTIYLSNDFYLEYISNRASFTECEPVVITLRNGTEVACDVIRAVSKIEGDYIPFDSIRTGETKPVEPDETIGQTRISTLEYAIGQEDGLFYRVTHAGEDVESQYPFAHIFYYPDGSLQIPEAYTENPVLAENVALKRSGVLYGSYYKGKKTCLGAADFLSKKTKSLTLKSKIKIGKRSYTVDRIAWRAFMNMTGLKKITIPRTVTVIEEEAFKGCSSLKKMVVRNKNIRKKLKNNKSYRKKLGIAASVKIV